MNDPQRENDLRRMGGQEAGCQRISEHLHAYIEGELDRIRASLVREHLTSCEACRQIAEELKVERLWLLEAAVKSPALSESFTAKVSKRIEQAVHAQARSRRRALFFRAGGSVAAAAVLLTALLFRGGSDESPSPAVVLKQDRVSAVEAARVAEPLLPPAVHSPIVHPPVVASFLPERALEKPRSRNLEGTAESPVAFIQPAAFKRRTTDSNFGNVIGMAVRLSPYSESAAEGPARDDPCRPDPNKDGKTDLIDVAYSCQVLLVGQPPSPFEASDSKPAEITDCDESCLRA